MSATTRPTIVATLLHAIELLESWAALIRDSHTNRDGSWGSDTDARDECRDLLTTARRLRKMAASFGPRTRAKG